MRQPPRPKLTRWRVAIAASVVVHVLLVVALNLALRSTDNPAPAVQAAFDTGANEPVLRLNAEERSIPVPIAEPPVPPDPPPPEASQPKTPETPLPSEPANNTARPPLKTIVPNTLPPELIGLIRRPARNTTFTDPNVKPAGAVSSVPAVAPLHGTMKPGQTIVYVLDCSGSMGEFGKLALARAVLLETLRRQSETVKFQILAYNSTARAVCAGGWVGVTQANLAAAEIGLAKLTASGRSNHIEAVRTAAALRPDVIVLLTDADDLTANSFKAIFGGKPIPLCVAKVTADGVRPPQELR